MITKLRFNVALLFILAAAKGLAQAPAISYVTPQVYTVGTAITALSPTNTGGAVPTLSPVVLSTAFNDARGIAVDASGNIYVANLGSNNVLKVPAGGGTAVAIGSGFNQPAGVAVDASGNVYVTDDGNNAVKKIPAGGGSITTLGSGITHPYGIAIDVSGNLYVTDSGNNLVKEIAAGTGTVTTLASGFSTPTGIALDASGNIYVCDRGHNAIKKIPAGGGTATTIATADGNPNGVAVDASGNVYYADVNLATLVEIPGGTGTPIAVGSGFSSPASVATDTSGDIYVVDDGANTAYEIYKNSGFKISPALPAGLTLDQNIGTISGTPSATSPATNYTVTAYNNSGSGTATINITVNAPATPVISYTTPDVYTATFAITPLSPTSSGGAVVSYAVSPALPAGLTLNTTTGVISGTPSAVSSATNYTVSATNTGGTGTTVITITVNPPAAPVISYTTPDVYTATFAITALSPTNSGGAAVSYAVSPALPAGLTLNTATGVISGTPTAVSSATNYTVSATNTGGTGTTTVTITVNPPATPVISYSTPNVYTAEVPITALTPVKSGGTAVSYAVSPALPQGLILNTSTGVISGDPMAASPATSYTVGATNLGGTGTATVNITVNLPAVPAINYASPQVYSITKPITALVPTNSGGSVVPKTPVTLASGSFTEITGIAADASGNVYVADAANQSVYKVPAGGGTAVAIGSGWSGPAGIAVDASGNVYVGNLSSGTIQKIPAGGGSVVTVGSGFSSPVGFALDGAGFLYFCEPGNKLVRKIPVGGGTVVNIGTGFTEPYGLAVDGSGNVYVADYGANAIKKIAAGSGTTTTVSSGSGSPFGVVVDASGNLFYADGSITTLVEIPVTGGKIAISSGITSAESITIDASGDLFTNNQQTVVEIPKKSGYNLTSVLPAGLSLDETTGIISGTPTTVTAAANYTITAYNGGGGSAATVNITVNPLEQPNISYSTPHVYTLATAITALTPTNTGGAVSGSYTISPSLPRGLGLAAATGVISGTPTIYSPATTYTVTASNASGTSTATLNITVSLPAPPNISYPTPQVFNEGDGITTITPANSGGAAKPTAAILSSRVASNPRGVAVDAAGNVYLADNGNNVIREIPVNGSPITTVGSGFSAPTGVAIDAAGDIFVADNGNHAVKKIPAGGGSVVTVGSGFTGPYGVAVDGPGNLYVSDITANVVKKIAAGTSTITTIGTGFNAPCGIAVDASGNVYVADRGNNLVKKIAVGGTITTVGSGFTEPFDVALDAGGDIYIADDGNHSVKKILASGGSPFVFYEYNNQAQPVGVAVDSKGNVYVTDDEGLNISEVFLSPTGTSGFTVSPALPAGLTMDPLTGIISGTPTTPTAAANYTVTASNPGGSGNAVINIRVNPNNTLSALSVSVGTLSPAFASTGTSYTVAEAAGQASITVTAVAAGSGETIKINGTTVASGTASPAIPLSFGPNTINVAVTVNSLTQTYTITATRAGGDATLSNLTVSAGTLSPPLAAGTSSYTMTEPYTVSSITMTPTVNAAGSTVKVNGTAVTSGTASAAIPLSVGSNTITVVGTASDGVTTRTYTFTVTRSAPSTNSNLAGLVISNGTLSPAFSSTLTNYTASVGNGLTTMTVTPTAQVGVAVITVNGTTVASGSASGYLPLVVGANVVNIVVTAQDGTTQKTYKLTINEARSANNNLSALVTSSGTLSPAFAAATTSYTETVASSVSSITVTPTTADATATITVNGTAVTSGSASGAIALAAGANTITTVVTAQNTVTKTYTLTVTRSASVNVNLSALTISNGTLSPAFSPGATVYTASVGGGLASMTVTPTASDPAATIKVNGTAVTSGSASAAIPLVAGANTINIVVTGSDGVSTQTYKLTVTEAKSTNDNLLQLKTSGGLAQGQTVPTSLTESVPNSVNPITVTPTVADATATVTVNGTAVASGTASGGISLVVGANTITIVVTAQSGATKTYTLVVTRGADASLSNLVISNGVLSPPFKSATLAYTTTVGAGLASMTVTPTSTDPEANIAVNGKAVVSGSASGAIALVVGTNTITIAVTGSDGKAKITYTLTVKEPPSTNDNLSSFKTDAGLSHGLTVPTTLTESVSNSVQAIVVTPTAVVAASGITVNGTAVPSGTASPRILLAVGANTITTIVTAESGATQTYTLTVTKAGPENIPDAAVSVDKPTETIQLADDGINVHQGVSPNGDGINDFLQIDNIANYPDNHLSIMNRNGQLVYEAKNYDNASKTFDGHSNKNGQMQLPGTYFYSLDYTVKGVTRHKTGFLVLKY